MKLKPGDKVCINQHAFKNEFVDTTVIATAGSLATVLSYDEYRDHIYQHHGWDRHFCTEHLGFVKEGIDKGIRYPIRFDMVVQPSDDLCVYWQESYVRFAIECEVGGIIALDSGFLTTTGQHSSIVDEKGFLSQDIRLKTFGKHLAPLIRKGAKTPCEGSQGFSTAMDNQQAIEIAVYGGNGEFADSVNLLGRYEVGNLPKAPKGVLQIAVTFRVSTSGDINIEAIDGKTGGTFIVDTIFEKKC